MHTLFTALRRLLVWLSESDRPSESVLTARDWADLPTWHPCT